MVLFFQAEDGIRDYKVTGVQTCALPIWMPLSAVRRSPARARTAPVKAPGTWPKSADIAASPRRVAQLTSTKSPSSCRRDRKSTRLNSSHLVISYAVFCLKKKKTHVTSEY